MSEKSEKELLEQVERLQFRPPAATVSGVGEVSAEMTVHRHESKGERIVRNCVETGEPFFVLRAKDLLSVPALKKYLAVVDDYEGAESPYMTEDVALALGEFRRWQRANPDKVRLPD